MASLFASSAAICASLSWADFCVSSFMAAFMPSSILFAFLRLSSILSSSDFGTMPSISFAICKTSKRYCSALAAVAFKFSACFLDTSLSVFSALLS